MDLNQQVIVVTGGSGFLGQSFIKSIATHNGIAIIADVDDYTGQQTKEKLKTETGLDQIYFQHIDINEKSSICQLVSQLIKQFGRIDALVNNAYFRNERFWDHFFDVQLEDFNENLTMNLGGYFLCSQQFAEYFKKQGYGNIINVSSIYGVIPPKFEIYKGTSRTTPVVYASFKSALLHLSKYMAKYLKGLNIRVNSISPGGVYNNENV